MFHNRRLITYQLSMPIYGHYQCCHCSVLTAMRRQCQMLNEKTKFSNSIGTSLTVQWLRVHASNEVSTGLMADQGTKIPHAM